MGKHSLLGVMEFMRVEEFIKEVEKENTDNSIHLKPVIEILTRAENLIIDFERPTPNIYFQIIEVLDIVEIYYFDGIFLFSLTNFCDIEVSIDRVKRIKEIFYEREETFHKAYDNGNFSEVSMLVDKKLCSFIYKRYFDMMSREDKFQEFIELYKMTENAMNFVTQKMLKELIRIIPKNVIENRKNSRLIDNEGYVVVFRGQGNNSTNPQKAMSWTTDIEVANFFAKRFDKNGYIVRGKVHYTNIILIYDEEFSVDNKYKDSEKEVLVIPGKVIDIIRLE